MKSKQMLRPLAAILLFTFLATADSESHLLVKSKCKCLTVTSKTVVSESPTGGRVEQLMRDIKIIVPMRSRENISDPTSPLRTKFVYKISDFCKDCNQKPTSPGEPQCKPEPPSADTCYSSDNKECLYHKINLGNGRQMDAVLNPECLRHEQNHWIPEPTQPPIETTYDPSSMSDAP
ncbi:immunoglobulin J chain-like [Pristis pectinata]|uniref:immunoglobulin J chain-like n=1 Tax=Pristis pectinata TaxID=685728 RepID=UPI00223D5FCC|nr:immunoglobulin J chain-like [Pristis pectinata]